MASNLALEPTPIQGGTTRRSDRQTVKQSNKIVKSECKLSLRCFSGFSPFSPELSLIVFTGIECSHRHSMPHTTVSYSYGPRSHPVLILTRIRSWPSFFFFFFVFFSVSFFFFLLFHFAFRLQPLHRRTPNGGGLGRSRGPGKHVIGPLGPLGNRANRFSDPALVVGPAGSSTTPTARKAFTNTRL